MRPPGNAPAGRRRFLPKAGCDKAFYPDPRCLSRSCAFPELQLWHLAVQRVPDDLTVIAFVRNDYFCGSYLGNQRARLGAQIVDLASSDFNRDWQSAGIYSQVDHAGVAGSAFPTASSLPPAASALCWWALA